MKESLNYRLAVCIITNNTLKIANNKNPSIKEIIICVHPLSLSYMYTSPI